MDQEQTTLEQFIELFQGSETYFGESKPTGQKKENGKEEYKSWIQKHSVETQDFQDHINGSRHIGTVPIRDDSTCTWGVIDVDIYNLDHVKLIKLVREREYPLVPYRSKSNGLHLILHLSEPVEARKVRRLLNSIAADLGVAGTTTDIFPAQDYVDLTPEKWEDKNKGNFVNLPYQRAARTTRMALYDNGMGIPLNDLYKYVEKFICSEQDLETIIKHEKKEDDIGYPPCVKSFLRNKVKDGEGRNDAMFNCAVLCKKLNPDPDYWPEYFREMNKQIGEPPLDPKELNTLIKQHQKTDYKYKCKDQPMCSFCDSSQCRKREFGIGGDFEFGFDSIKKYQTENSIWYITIDGRQVRVRTKTLHKQDLFQETVYDQINIILPDLSRKDWKLKLQEIGNNAEIIEMGDDVSPEGRFDQHLHAYVNDQGKGLTIDEVNYGKAFEEKDKIYFKMEFLLMYLEKQRFKGFDAVRVAARLKERDAKSVVRKVEKKNTRLWEIDNESFKRIESLPLPKEEDLNKEENLPF